MEEGSTSGEAIDTSTRSIRRGSGHGTSEKVVRGYRGRPVAHEGSDGVVVVRKPGNSGGAKGPDFRHAFQDGEGKVIGDEPGNT